MTVWMMLLQLKETGVDDADGRRDADKTQTQPDRGQTAVRLGQSVVGWRPGVTDWLTEKARRVGIRGTW